MLIKIKPSAIGGYGGLNPISLREDGWTGRDHVLEAGDRPLPSGEYLVHLPNGERKLSHSEFIIIKA